MGIPGQNRAQDFQSVAAVTRFHLAAGVRLAVGAAAPIAGVAVFAVGMSPNPTATLNQLARSLMLEPAFSPVATTLAVVSLLLARYAGPRISLGFAGWVRHLPVSGASHRRAMLLALAAAQAPVGVLWAGLWLIAWHSGTSAVFSRLAALAPVLLGASYAAAPVRRRTATVPAGLLMVGLGLIATLPAMVTAAIIMGGAECVSGAPVLRGRAFVRLHLPGRLARDLLLAVTLRATGARLWRVYLACSIPLLATWLFLANNSLQEAAVHRAVRFGCGTAVAVLFAGAAAMIAVRRPPWPWIRSLPFSSARRALSDAVFFFLLSLPVLSASLWLEPGAVWPLVPFVAFLSLRGAGSLRLYQDAKTGSWGPVFAESFLAALAIALSGWTALGFAALLWSSLGRASRLEQELEACRWFERHHLAAGDTLSWRGE